MLTFAAISPHPPILLPTVGSKEDREKVKKTLDALSLLEREFKKPEADTILISSPHTDWGYGVPLHFIAPNFKGKVETILTGAESPNFYFEKGREVYSKFIPQNAGQNSKLAFIASGDLSHCLMADGPYGFNPDGPKFDRELIDCLKKKDIKNILKLDEKFPEAGECGLRSFCFLLGILDASGLNWQPKILSYEGPFGVGYLVSNFQLK